MSKFVNLLKESSELLDSENMDEGIKDWAKKAIAGIALAGIGMTATQAQAKPMVSAINKQQAVLANKLADVVNTMVGQEYDVQVVQVKKGGKVAQQLNILKDGKKIVTVDHLFGTGAGGQIWDKEAANTLGSGSYTPNDAANEVFHSFAKVTESSEPALEAKENAPNNTGVIESIRYAADADLMWVETSSGDYEIVIEHDYLGTVYRWRAGKDYHSANMMWLTMKGEADPEKNFQNMPNPREWRLKTPKKQVNEQSGIQSDFSEIEKFNALERVLTVAEGQKLDKAIMRAIAKMTHGTMIYDDYEKAFEDLKKKFDIINKNYNSADFDDMWEMYMQIADKEECKTRTAEQVNEEIDPDVLDKGDKQKEIMQVMSTAIAVGLAQIENIVGESFDDAREAEKFFWAMVRNMRTGSAASDLKTSLRRFDRIGGERTIAKFRKDLAHV